MMRRHQTLPLHGRGIESAQRDLRVHGAEVEDALDAAVRQAREDGTLVVGTMHLASVLAAAGARSARTARDGWCAVNGPRLLALADLLDNFETERPKLATLVDTFDLSVWLCGTAACAGGFASLHPVFRALGLGTSYDPELGDEVPTFRGRTGFNAIQDFFELTFADAGDLFSAEAYGGCVSNPTPSIVARRIRFHVAATTADAALAVGGRS